MHHKGGRFLVLNVFRFLESSQLGFSSLFLLFFLVCMSAIKVYLKGEEVQCLKEEAFEGRCINRKISHIFEGHSRSQEVHQQKVGQFVGLKVHYQNITRLKKLSIINATNALPY